MLQTILSAIRFTLRFVLAAICFLVAIYGFVDSDGVPPDASPAYLVGVYFVPLVFLVAGILIAANALKTRRHRPSQ